MYSSEQPVQSFQTWLPGCSQQVSVHNCMVRVVLRRNGQHCEGNVPRQSEQDWRVIIIIVTGDLKGFD
jgi:hypothetical protein